jgi:hypothetical protein
MQHAQLKAQIRDEHLRDDSKRKRTKQHFSSMKDRQRTEAHTTTVTTSNPSGTESSSSRLESDIQGSTSESSTNFTSHSSSPNNSPMPTSPDPQASTFPETFSSFVNQQRALVIEDDTDNEPLFDINTILPARRGPAQTTRLPLLKLANELFDFSNTHWVAAVRNAQEASFDKELEFYELLDLDAEGEDDVDVDNTTEQVLGFEYY